MWTSTVRPISRHGLALNEDVGPAHFRGRRRNKIRVIATHCPAFIWPSVVVARVLPSRCARCGAVSRDFLCGPCLDFLVADRPMWLNPGLLPGPSLLDLTAANEVAIAGADLSEVAWHLPTRDSGLAEA